MCATWADAAVSTDVRALEAVEATEWSLATEYVDFFVDEADVIFGFFRGLIPDAIAFLEARGMSRADLTELNRSLLALIRLPDGRPFVARQRWADFKAQVRRCMLAGGAADREAALAGLAELKETWR